MQLKTKFSKNQGTLIVSMDGELDHHSASEVREQIEKLIENNNVNNIIFDMKDLKFMDSSGIGIIIGRYKFFNKIGGKTLLCNINSRIDRIIDVSGLKKIIPIYNSVNDALKNI